MTTTVDDVLKALEQKVRTYLPDVLDRYATEKGVPLPLPPDEGWGQVSGPEAAARLMPQQTPRISFSSPGYASDPVKVAPRVWDLEWECVIAFYVRANGPSYGDVATLVRLYTSALLEAALTDQSLGGIADAVVPVAADHGGSEDPNGQRTLGGGFVQVNVHVPRALDLTSPLTDGGVVIGVPPQPDGWSPILTVNQSER